MKAKRKLISVLLALLMIFSMLPATAFAAELDSGPQFPDMPDNWSTAALQSAVANGLLNGIDGKILPGANLTRAQMATVIVRAFGASVAGGISGYSDVKASDWFFDSMAKAYQMGVIQGYDGKMNPNSAITREEVFVIIARAFRLQPAATINRTFTDVGQISSWAKGEVYALVNAGYLQGSGGLLNPKSLITRAEFAQIFDNIVKQYIQEAGTVTTVASGNIMVNVPGVTLKNVDVTGDLIIGDGVGDGAFILENVDVSGRVVVRGGGVNSVIIRGTSNVSSVVVARVDGEVSVKVQGDANVEVIYIDDGSDDVTIEGTVGTLDIEAQGITVTASRATITSAGISGSGVTLAVGSGSTVGTVTTSASGTTITGGGAVTKVEVQSGANNASVSTPSTQIVVGAGVTGVTGAGGAAIGGGTTATNNSSGTGLTAPTAGGGGGGGGDDSTPVVIQYPPTASSVGITGAAQVGETLIGSYTYADANGDPEGTSLYKWYKSTGDGYTAITGATSRTYLIPADMEGKTLKFEVTPVAATGTATGTAVMSAATSVVVARSTLSDISVAGLTDAGGTLNFTSSQAGTYYYIVLAADATAPDATVIVAAQTDLTISAAARGTGVASVAPSAVGITGLERAKAYKAYLVVDSAAGLSDVSAVSFTTRRTTVTPSAITGIAVPVPGATPATAITPTDQFTGTVVWNFDHSTFKAGKNYTATITLTAKSGYTLSGIAADSFTVPGASPVSNAAGSGVVFASFPMTTVTTAAQFNAALADNEVTTVTLGGNITGNVSATRAEAGTLALDFGPYALTGNFSLTANSVTAITLNGTAVPAISGNLTISAPLATVTNHITVGGTVTIDAVSTDTWIEFADGNSIYIDDGADNATIQINGVPGDVEIEAGASGLNITALNPVGIIVQSGASVSNIIVGANAAGTTIENNGTVAGVIANANINIQSNTNVAVFADETIVVGASDPSKIGGVIAVQDISAKLTGLSGELRVGSGTGANITAIDEAIAGAGETYNVVSADTSIVSVDAATGLALTPGQHAGKAAVTVQIKNLTTGAVIRQGTIFVTVLPAQISSASVTMAVPVLGAAPQTAAQVQGATDPTNSKDYTVTGLVWNEAMTPAGKFKAGQVYTAAVTLTSKNGKAFQTTPFAPAVGTAFSVGNTTASGSAAGNSVTFAVTFPTTLPLSVTGIRVADQPQMVYTFGQELDLSGMKITETYNDGTTGTVEFTDGTASGYAASPENDAELTLTHSYTAVTITHTASGQTATTGKLVVNNNQQTDLTALSALAAVAATPGNNDGAITGTTTAMEYKAAGASAYTAITGTSVTGLAPGNYLVRLKAKLGYDPSPAVTVLVPGLSSIALNTSGAKLTYKIGEALDITGLIVTGTYTDGSTKIETITAGDVTNFNSSAAVTSQTLTVTLDIRTATYNVSISKLDGLALPGSVVSDNAEDEMDGMSDEMEFSTDGTIWETYDETPTPNLPDLTGNVTLYVRMAETSTRFAGPAKAFQFSERILDSIEITTLPTKTVYKVGEALDISGMVVTGTYDDESTQIETITVGNVTGFNGSSVTASQTLTVHVGDEIDTYPITVIKADGPALAGVAADDTANRMYGMTTAMQFSTNGTSWDLYDGSNLPALTGNVMLYVRVASTDTHEAGPATTFTFTTNRYTLTYIAGTGGSISGNATQIVDYDDDGTAVTAVASAGYTFAGWSDGVATAARTDENVRANKTVTANFTLNQYTVVFKNYDGTELKSQAVKYGSDASEPTPNPTRVADARYTYIFSGWDRTFTNVTGNLTVTATYSSTVRQYTVTFVDWNGTPIGTPQNVAYGSAATAPANPTRSGYLFAGWDVPFSNITGTLTVTATYRLNVLITAFDPIPDVAAGAAGSVAAPYDTVAGVQAALPKVVTANSGAVTVSVTWANTDSYNPAVAGRYTFTAVLGGIPTGFSNANNLTATVEVVVRGSDALGGEPVITAGTPATVGTELTAGPGTLSPSTNLTYKWYRSTDAVWNAGDTLLKTETAETSTYTPVEADVGKYLIIAVTSTNATGTKYVATGAPVAPTPAITLSLSEDSASVVQGGTLPETTATLSSNYDASGLTTVVSLTKDDVAVDFGTLFSSYKLSTTVGATTDGPYEMIQDGGEYSSFTYGPTGGYPVTAEEDQVTTVNGAVKDTAPTGDYTITTEVKVLDGGAVLATGTYTLTVTEASIITRADGDVTQDPGYTGGTALLYDFDGSTKTLAINADGTYLPYYPQAGTTPPSGANWVGIAIPVPDGVTTTEVTATINGAGCTDLYFAEGKYMEYINVKSGDLTDGAATYEWVIHWGAGYADEMITINVTNVAGLAVPDTTDPTLDGVTPARGPVELDYAETFVLTVDAEDENLYELEIDHNIGALPEFSVYANASNPYGTEADKEQFEETYDVTVAYDAAEQKWTIDFGPGVTGTILSEGGITFYIVLKDTAGNQWGTMYGTTPENTFAYTVTRADLWDGTLQTPVIPVGNTYKINTGAELAWVAAQVNAGTNDFAGKTVELLRNIDLGGHEWTPIGWLDAKGPGTADDELLPFKGTFDGKGKTVNGLKISAKAGWDNGFFGRTNGGEIKDVTFVDANVQDLGGTLNSNTAIVAGYTVDTDFANVRIEGGTVAGSRVASIVGAFTGDARMIGCSSSATLNAKPTASHKQAVIGGLVQQVEISGSLTDTTVSTFDNENITVFEDCSFTGTINVNATNFNQGATANWLWVGQLFGGTAHGGYYNLGIKDCVADGTVNVTNLTATTPYLDNNKLLFSAYINGSAELSLANHTANGGVTPLQIVPYGRVLETYGIYTDIGGKVTWYNGVYNSTSGSVLYDNLEDAIGEAESDDTIVIATQLGDADNFTLYNVTKPVAITGAFMNTPVIYGTFHVYADGVRFDNLEIHNQGGGVDAQKAAIDVLARQVSITNCKFVMGVEVPPKKVANGVAVWPLGTADFELVMTGNTFEGYKAETDKWSSCAFQITENIDIPLSRFTLAAEHYGAKPKTGAITVTAAALQAIAEANEYTQCANDFIYQDWAKYASDEQYKFVYATSEQALLGGIEYAGEDATVAAAAGEYEFEQQINITKSLALVGLGNVTLKAANDSWSTENGYKHLLGIYAGTPEHEVLIENIVLDADGKSHAVNTYDNACVILKDVTIKNGKGAGLTVNGSAVTAENLSTSGNAWGAVNVDPGSGVSTPSAFTLSGTGTLAEDTQIWSDGKYVDDGTGTPAVSVAAEDAGGTYAQYPINGGDPNARVWSNKTAAELPGISLNGTIYATLQAAIGAAETGDTIKVRAGVYVLNDNVTIPEGKALTIQGANAGVDPNTGTRAAESVLKGNTSSGLSYRLKVSAGTVIDGLTFDNLRINNCTDADGEDEDLIDGVAIKNNIFTDVVGTAIYLRNGVNNQGVFSENVAVLNNQIIAPAGAGTADYEAGSGMAIMGAETLSVRGNVVTDASYIGIQIPRNKNVTVSGNTVTGSAQPALQSAEWDAGTFTVSRNTFSTDSTGKGAVRLYGFSHSYFPTFNITENTIRDSAYGIQIGHGDPGKGNDLVTANYNFSDNTFEDIREEKLIVYLQTAATAADIAEMDALFVQVYGAGVPTCAVTGTDPFTYVKAPVVNTTQGKGYGTIQAAVGAAVTGDTIVLGVDVDLGSDKLTINSGDTLTLDLNGHNIAGDDRLITLSHGTLNLTGAGTIKETSPNYAPIILKGSFDDVANYTVLNVGEDVVLEGWAGVFITTNTNDVSGGPSHAYGVVVNMNGSINSVKDTGGSDGAGIFLNGSNADDTGNVPVINIGATAKITATGEGVYAAGYGKWTVADGASIAGDITGFEIRAGELTVNGGSVTGGDGELVTNPNGNGSTTANCALAIAQHTTKKPINVRITGGTFEGTAAFNEADPQGNHPGEDITIAITGGTFKGQVASFDCTGFITGGTFSAAVDDDYLASGYTCVKGDDGTSWVVILDEGE